MAPQKHPSAHACVHAPASHLQASAKGPALPSGITGHTHWVQPADLGACTQACGNVLRVACSSTGLLTSVGARDCVGDRGATPGDSGGVLGTPEACAAKGDAGMEDCVDRREGGTSTFLSKPDASSS